MKVSQSEHRRRCNAHYRKRVAEHLAWREEMRRQGVVLHIPTCGRPPSVYRTTRRVKKTRGSKGRGGRLVVRRA